MGQRKQEKCTATSSSLDFCPRWYSYMCEEIEGIFSCTEKTAQQITASAVQSLQSRSQDRLRNSVLKQKCMWKTLQPDPVVERAIWIFYHDQLQEASSTDPNGANQTNLHFFQHILDRWQDLSMSRQRFYTTCSKQHMSMLPIPMMPDDFVLPTDDEGASATIKIPSCDLVTDTMSRATPVSQFRMYSLETLEKLLAVDIEILEQIGEKLAPCSDIEQSHWTQRIDQILQERSPPKNVFGITGSTGVGKSTTINALLGRHLLPTSGGRACTAIPHVVEHNAELADTEVEILVSYINKDSWAHEIKLLLARLNPQEEGNDTSSNEDEEELMRLWDKFRIVYPELSKLEAAQTGLADLVNHENVCHLLGQTEAKSAQTTSQARTILEQLNGISTQSENQEQAQEKSAPWPLVRDIRLQINNPLLSKGIKIVDLPGVNDSNRARAAVARKYTNKCTSMVVMAPIGRATNDSGARDLLLWCSQNGLHFDDSSLTFICNQADTIDEPNVSGPEFKVQKSIEKLRQKQIDAQRQINLVAKEVQKLQADEAAAEHVVGTVKKEMESTQNELMELEDQLPIDLVNAGEKRKSRANTKLMKGDDSRTSKPRDVVEEENHEQRLLKLRSKSRTIWRNFKSSSESLGKLSQNLAKKNAQIQPLEEKISMIECQIWQVCIAGRGEEAKAKVRKDYADFLRDLILQQEHGHPNGDVVPDEHESFTVEAMANKLPVLIISARAYRELCVSQNSQTKRALASKEAVTALSSYQSEEETGVPALRQHLIEQTNSKRKVHVIQVLNKTSALIDSFDLWASGNELDERVTEKDLVVERAWLEEKLSNVCEIVKAKAEDMQNNFGSVMQQKIFTKLLESRTEAEIQAPTIASRFLKEAGSFQTCRAILVRDGVFTSRSRGSGKGIIHDFNKSLLQPINQLVDPGWNSAFGVVLEKEFSTNKNVSFAPMNDLHTSVCSRAKALGCSIKSLKILNLQHERVLSRIEDINSQRHQDLQFKQRDARHILYNRLRKALQPIYAEAAALRGRGSVARTADTMIAGVDKVKASVFSKGINKTVSSLEAAWEKAASSSSEEALEVIANYAKDCETMFRSTEDRLTKEERKLGCDILEILETRNEKLEAEGLNAVLKRISDATDVDETENGQIEDDMGGEDHGAMDGEKVKAEETPAVSVSEEAGACT